MRPLVLQPDSSLYGACRALLRVTERMDRPTCATRGVVVFPYEGDAVAAYEAAGFAVVIDPDMAILRRSDAGPIGLIRLALRTRRSARRLAHLIREHELDLVHTNSMVVLGGSGAARSASVPHVWHLREAPAEGGVRRAVFQRLLRRGATMVVAVSEAAAALAPAGVRVRIVPDGYDAPGATPEHSERTGPLRLTILGRISPTKAQLLAVEALARAVHADVDAELTIAGTVYPGYEPYAEQLLERAALLGVADRVHTLGWLDDPAPLLEHTDVLLSLTGQGEGFGLAVLEAMAHGATVISASTGGTSSLVIDGTTGLTATPHDPTSIAHAISRLADDPALLARVRAGAREHARRFDVQTSCSGLTAAWRDALNASV